MRVCVVKSKLLHTGDASLAPGWTDSICVQTVNNVLRELNLIFFPAGCVSKPVLLFRV